MSAELKGCVKWLIYFLDILKGCLHYKTIFCNKCIINDFLFEEKMFRSQDKFLCFCEIHRIQNLWRHHKHCYIMEVTLMFISFESWSPIKMELGQILVCCLTNISNMFLAQCWRLETSSRPFYDFIKMIIGRDLASFDSWHLPF